MVNPEKSILAREAAFKAALRASGDTTPTSIHFKELGASPLVPTAIPPKPNENIESFKQALKASNFGSSNKDKFTTKPE